MRAGTVIHGRIRNTYRQFSGPKYAKIADTPNPPNSVPHGYAVWCRPWAKPLRSHGHHSTTAVTSTASPAPPNAFLMDCRIVMLVNDWVKPLMPVKMEKTMYPKARGTSLYLRAHPWPPLSDQAAAGSTRTDRASVIMAVRRPQVSESMLNSVM